MTPDESHGTKPEGVVAAASTRVVVIVPRREPGVHEYLQRALACIKDIEVVLDRRAAVVTPADDRRRRPDQGSERQLLLCSLVHCPVQPTATAATPPSSETHEAQGHPRTLLWPDLRLEHL